MQTLSLIADLLLVRKARANRQGNETNQTRKKRGKYVE
jgi:hypothetical protein